MKTELLESVYNQIANLRSKGIKMKDIASYTNLPSSVLSALYSTVLPTYISNMKQQSKEEALDYAISRVNNVSKKRLLDSIDDIHNKLQYFEPNYLAPDDDLFPSLLDKFAKKLDDISLSYLGTYISYSLSSSKDALKVEPFVLIKDGQYIKVMRKNVYDSINSGMAIISNGHSMYIMLNELDNSQLAMVTIYLQLPFYENTNFLRGIYMTLDYNRNPIARRIIFVKKSNQSSITELDLIDGEIIQKESFTSELEIYYNYTSQTSDIIRMCSIPFPQLSAEDLIVEKKILEDLTLNNSIGVTL